MKIYNAGDLIRLPNGITCLDNFSDRMEGELCVVSGPETDIKVDSQSRTVVYITPIDDAVRKQWAKPVRWFTVDHGTLDLRVIVRWTLTRPIIERLALAQFFINAGVAIDLMSFVGLND